MTGIPPELQKFTPFLNVQPALVRITFQYCLCLILVEAGKMELTETIPGANGPLCTFRTVSGELFRITQPEICKEQQVTLIEQLRVTLDKELGQL